ncbi:MAG: NAD(P)-dependent oxidoreductase [Nitrospinae bacterium]|nr:NAD(P)-dependent oxidoreductase [Nitrospinota bacterium]
MLIGITGSHGFIGQNLVEFLSSRQGTEVRRFDRKKKSLDVSSFKSFVSGLDVLFHIGGLNRADDSELVRANIIGTSNLLEAIKLYGKPDDLKFIFISSFQVYPLFETIKAIAEDAVPNPQTLFGITKRCGEDLIRISGIKSVIVRLSNVYGPLCRPFYNSVISTFCELAARGKPITVNGDGSQARDFIFIGDVVSAFGELIGYPVQGTETFNLCGGKLFSLKDILGELEKVSGKRAVVEYKPVEGPNGYQLGDNGKIRKALGWDVKTPLSEGLRKTYRWFEGQKI